MSLFFEILSCMRFSRYVADNSVGLPTNKLGASVFPVTPAVFELSNGEYEIRTRDLLLARQALSQLS